MGKKIEDILLESMEKDNQIHKLLLSMIEDLEKRIEKLEETLRSSLDTSVEGD